MRRGATPLGRIDQCSEGALFLEFFQVVFNSVGTLEVAEVGNQSQVCPVHRNLAYVPLGDIRVVAIAAVILIAAASHKGAASAHCLFMGFSDQSHFLPRLPGKTGATPRA